MKKIKLAILISAFLIGGTANAAPLFQDDFSDTLSEWELSPESGADFSIANGELVQSNTSPGVLHNDLYVPSGFDWSDYEVSFKTRHVSGFYSVTALGITIRRQPDSNNYSGAGYTVDIHGGGFVQLYKRDNVGKVELLQASDSGTLPVPNDKGYQVKVRAVGDWIQVWVDGTKYIDVHDATYKTGTVSFESVHVVGGFDDVVVTPVAKAAIKDTVSWAKTPYSVQCKNNTTAKSVAIAKNKTADYDCEKAGLKVKSGDDVSVTIRGKKY